VDRAPIEATRTAFHIACDSLQLECDVGDPMTEIIVTKIIALAKAGKVSLTMILDGICPFF